MSDKRYEVMVGAQVHYQRGIMWYSDTLTEPIYFTDDDIQARDGFKGEEALSFLHCAGGNFILLIAEIKDIRLELK